MNKPNPDADLLRRAATLARETAQAATSNVCPDWTWLAVRHVARNCELECPTHGDDHEVCNQWDRHDDSPHMSLWHPGVALAVAAWLEACADTWPTQPVITTTETRSRERRSAVAVARALLNEPEDT